MFEFAALVVKEIIDGGGKAVYNDCSVLDGDKIIEHALKEFNSVDILINNAGEHPFYLFSNFEEFCLKLQPFFQVFFATSPSTK